MKTGSKILGPFEITWNARNSDDAMISISLERNSLILAESLLNTLQPILPINFKGDGQRIVGEVTRRPGDLEDTLVGKLHWTDKGKTNTWTGVFTTL